MMNAEKAAWVAIGLGFAGLLPVLAHAEPMWREGEPLGFKDITELNLADLLAAPVVESAARRKQSIEDAPAAMDIFTGDEIVAAGITSLAEILRRAPGMFVVQTNAGRFDVGLRGVAGLLNNRVLVLLNGRRLTDLDRGSPAWQSIPVHVGEIESIEVLRGPGTIIYGADALSGVINITTKRPLDRPGFNALFAAGNGWLPHEPGVVRSDLIDNLGSGFATYGVHNGNSTLGGSVTAGWDHVPDWVQRDESAIPHHGEYGFHASATLDWRRDERTSLILDFRHAQAEGQQTVDAFSQAVSQDSNTQSLTAVFRKEEIAKNTTLTLNADFQRRNESIAILGTKNILAPISASNPLDNLQKIEPVNYRAHLLAQSDLYMPRVRTVLSLGAETAYQITQQLFDVDYSQFYCAAIVQSETRLFRSPELLLNVGARVERVDVSAHEKGDARYLSLSPRVSLIAKFAGDHSLRLAAASAYRTPSLTEIADIANYNGVLYPAPAPPVYTVRSNLTLKPEQVRSAELGYRGRPKRWLRLDITGFLQELKNAIIFQRAQIPLVSENARHQWQSGAELGIKFQPTAAVGAHAAYAFTQTWDSDGNRSTGAFPSHIAQVGLDSSVRQTRFNLDFTYTSSIDPLLTQATPVGVALGHVVSTQQFILNARIGKQILDGNAEIFLQGTNLLAAVRSRADLVQYPVGGAHPIGLTVLAGIRICESGLGVKP